MTPWVILGAIAIGAGAGYWAGDRIESAKTARVAQECAEAREQAVIDQRKALAALTERLIAAEVTRDEIDRQRAAIERRATQRAQEAVRYRAERDRALQAALAPADCAVSANAIRLLDAASGATAGD